MSRRDASVPRRSRFYVQNDGSQNTATKYHQMLNYASQPDRTVTRLNALVTRPREDLNAEYKGWLDLRDESHKALIAKAAIALENHGGGYIIIGFNDGGQTLESTEQPTGIGEIDQDMVNSAVQKYAEPHFQCELHFSTHPVTNVNHPIVVVPGQVSVPVMSKRNRDGVIEQHHFYIRKPGPKSERPLTQSEWSSLIRRCVLADRNDLLNSIRTIVSGIEPEREVSPQSKDKLIEFVANARSRWQRLTAPLPQRADARFPLGRYEIAASPIDADPASSLVEIRNRIEIARQIEHTGWPPFIEFSNLEHRSSTCGDAIETWLGRGNLAESGGNVAVCDYWQASRSGDLYTISGYIEDEERSGRGASSAMQENGFTTT